MLKPKAISQVLGQATTGGVKATLYDLHWISLSIIKVFLGLLIYFWISFVVF